MLVCDGVSEGEFPNREVVKLAAEELRKGRDRPDPGAAATAVIRMALKQGSMDNISCMIVLLGGGEVPGKAVDFLPGTFVADQKPFREAYAAMALHAGLSLDQALEMRYDLMKQLLEGVHEDAADLREEMSHFGDGPPASLARGSPERTEWFNAWLEKNCGEDDEESIEQLLRHRPGLAMQLARQQGLVQPSQPDPTTRWVKVAAADQVRPAMAAMQGKLPEWTPTLEQVCGTQGIVKREDPADGTAEVAFQHNGISVWLPASTLTDVMFQVCAVDQLKPAVEEHTALKWNERLADTCGAKGVLLQKDTDETSQVRFPSLGGLVVWLPTPCLTEVVESAAGDTAEPESPTKRQRTEPA